MRHLAIAGLLTLAVAAPAHAATPENGTVSAASPTVSWSGTANGYGYTAANFAITTAGQAPAPCQAPACDTFTLTVADRADLNLLVTGTDGDNIELRVTKPDGETVFVSNVQPEERLKIKAAAPGEYVVGIATQAPMGFPGTYEASATLAIAPAQPVAPPAVATPPAPAAPAEPAPAASLGLATKSVSARKRRFRLALTSTGPVTGVKVALRKGRKVFARSSLRSLNGKGSVALKLRKKLKPGSYQVVLSATDGGHTVGLTTKLRVKK